MKAINLFTAGLATAVLTAGSLGAAAQTSSVTEMRGYSNCLAAAKTPELKGVTTPRVYYIASNGDSKTYFVNTWAWQDGERVARRINCETTNNGRKVLNVVSADGRYALNDRNGVVVANR